MPNIPFPNVPSSPGVPDVPRNTGSLLRTSGLGILQGALFRALQVQTKWGIYDSKGKALGDPSKYGGFAGSLLESAGLGSTLSTAAVEYSKETRVSDFPIERGSFASYNKVELPATPTVTLSLSGSEQNRRDFLNAIDAACKSTELYTIVTPEVSYKNYTIESYKYQRRSTKGATLLIVEITIKEIRQVSARYGKSTKSKDPGASPIVDSGKVQAKQPLVSTLKSLVNKLIGK